MNNYVINRDTLAILPNGKGKSLVYDGLEVYEVNMSPTLLIKRNCLLNGSSYEGRLKSSDYLINCKYKTPILVNDKHNLIFFPTNSTRLQTCSWISCGIIVKIYRSERGTSILFNTDVVITINISFYVIYNQYLRAVNLDSKLRKNRA
jgi:competence protein ComK